jgi:outer membrane protein TolC
VSSPQLGLSTNTVRAIDLRYLQRWSQSRRKPALRNMGVDEIHLGKKQKFITVVSNLDTGEPLWFGQDRKKDTLDEFFEKRLSPFQRGAVQAACVDMREPFRQSIEQWLPKCRILCDKFHIMQHANAAVDEVRRVEFFRKYCVPRIYELRILADNIGMNRKIPILISFLLSTVMLIPGYDILPGQTADEIPQVLSLNDCLRIAMEKNHSRPASQFAVARAEAQHRQALAAYWPQVNAKGGLNELSSSPNFIYPGQTFSYGQAMIPIPAQDIKLMGPNTESVSGDFNWLLFDGGMRKGFREQSLGAVNVAKAEARRTDLEMTESVIRLYYGAVLARQLHQLGKDTQERMEATLRMTESIYKDGSGTVNKADYLDIKVMTETVRSLVAPLEANEASAQAALAYTIGLSWKSSVIPRDEQIPFERYAGNLDELVSTAYEFNPDWTEINAGLKALEGERSTAVSGYFPKIGLKGELHRRWNSFHGGLSTPNNKSGWSVDAGVEIPIFDGFLTHERVAEARAKINQLKEKRLLLTEGLGLQLRGIFLDLEASEKVVQATQDAAASAKEDADLTLRGYQSGLITAEKVIRVELQEALITAARDKAVYEHRALQARIDLVVGNNVQAELSRSR